MGIITPYRAQLRLVNDMISSKFPGLSKHVEVKYVCLCANISCFPS
jgi:superfamily I DNA and/or RNA helicase